MTHSSSSHARLVDWWLLPPVQHQECQSGEVEAFAAIPGVARVEPAVIASRRDRRALPRCPIYRGATTRWTPRCVRRSVPARAHALVTPAIYKPVSIVLAPV